MKKSIRWEKDKELKHRVALSVRKVEGEMKT